MPLRACAMDWRQDRILRVGKNSSPVLSRLWTKVHKILGQYRGYFLLSKALARLCVLFHSEDIRHKVLKSTITEQM